MKRMKNLLAISVVFAALAISSSAFAGSLVGSEAGAAVVPSAKALAAASSYSYDQAYLQAVNSEAGADIIPSAKALAAAELFQYDQSKLASVANDGAENLYFASEHQSAQVMNIVNNAAKNGELELMCQTC